MLRPYNPATGAAPFESLMVADIGDISVNTFNIKKSMKNIHENIGKILQEGCTPLVLGGCHTISYGILKAMKVNSDTLLCKSSVLQRLHNYITT